MRVNICEDDLGIYFSAERGIVNDPLLNEQSVEELKKTYLLRNQRIGAPTSSVSIKVSKCYEELAYFHANDLLDLMQKLRMNDSNLYKQINNNISETDLMGHTFLDNLTSNNTIDSKDIKELLSVVRSIGVVKDLYLLLKDYAIIRVFITALKIDASSFVKGNVPDDSFWVFVGEQKFENKTFSLNTSKVNYGGEEIFLRRLEERRGKYGCGFGR